MVRRYIRDGNLFRYQTKCDNDCKIIRLKMDAVHSDRKRHTLENSELDQVLEELDKITEERLLTQVQSHLSPPPILYAALCTAFERTDAPERPRHLETPK